MDSAERAVAPGRPAAHEHGGASSPGLFSNRNFRLFFLGQLVSNTGNWLQLAAQYPELSMRPVEVNGGPGAIFLDEQERLLAVWSLEIVDGQIAGIRSIVNPDKLAHLGPVGDARSVLRRPR